MSFKRSRASYEADSRNPPQHAPYALYGTPLPAYDPEVRDDGSYIPIWKQEVTDERGRKRLHGAFTGGFSAGYFNTVGSKEGWTPSTFVSSRSQRSKDQKDGDRRVQRIEDFMDEEDLAEQTESQTLETQHAFAGLGGGSAEGAARGMFADIFRTTGETMGIKLLQRMGWKQGQGIGPKIKRRAKGDASGEAHFFAPENSQMIGFKKKTDRKGLGYAEEYQSNLNARPSEEQIDDADDSGEDARMLRTKRNKVFGKSKPIKKSGFGVGVLNDASDDEDPYSMGPRISYNRIIGMDRKKKKPGLMASNATPTVLKSAIGSKRSTHRTPAIPGFRKCHDGRLPLDGFVLSTAALSITSENQYPLPEIPEGWKSSKQSSTTAGTAPVYQSAADAARASTLDHKSRAALLGEKQLPGKSIFDFISTSDRDRIAAATGRQDLPPGRGEAAPAGFQQTEAEKRRTLWDFVPQLSKETAAIALQRAATGWMPYSEDADKRSRYRSFLELSAGLHSNLPEKPPTLTREDWAKELREFAEAAEIFKPVSGLMASRFTSSSNAPRLASDAPDPSPSTPATRREEEPAAKAARMGMYGPLTRSRQPFYPTRLLCKRFNVRPPANVGLDHAEKSGATGGAGGNGHRLELVSKEDLDRMMLHANLHRPSAFSASADGGSQGTTRPPDVKPTHVVDIETNEALEGRKAGEAVFKAIFGSDDEDE